MENSFGFIPIENHEEENRSRTTKNDFGFIESKVPDSLLKSIGRYAYAPISGALSATPYGVATSLWDLLATGESLSALEELDEERLKELKEKFPAAPWENFKGINREEYMKALQEARSTIPTISNIEKTVEEETGLPLEAKTKAQEALRLAGAAAKLRPGSIADKTTAAIAAPTVSTIAELAGVPESIAETAGLVTSGITPTPSLVKQVKPSGLPIRQYESLKKQTRVTPAQASGIRETVEKDIKSAVDSLIQKESATARALKEDAYFPQKLDQMFSELDTAIEKLPEKSVKGPEISNFLSKRMKKRSSKGLTPDESERAYQKEMERLLDESAFKDSSKTWSNKQVLDQYRKNNKELGQYFEPGKSKSANIGKRDALLDYNSAIADMWQEKFPNSEFNNLFKFTNKRYSELSDIQVIDDFFSRIFTDKKINYRDAKKFFENPKVNRSFKRTLGDKSYKEVEGIFKEFLPTEIAMKHLKEAEALGFTDMLKLGGKYLAFPLWGVGSTLSHGKRFLSGALLKNPKFRIEWKNALKNFKDKNFQKASISLEKLKEMEDQSEEEKS